MMQEDARAAESEQAQVAAEVPRAMPDAANPRARSSAPRRRRSSAMKTDPVGNERLATEATDAGESERSEVGRGHVGPSPQADALPAEPGNPPQRRRRARKQEPPKVSEPTRAEAAPDQGGAPPTPATASAPSGPSVARRTRTRSSRTRHRGEPDRKTLEVDAAPAAESSAGTASPARRAARPSSKAPTPAQTLRARVAVRRGLPELLLGEQTAPPAFFFGSADGATAAQRMQSQVRRASRIGVRVYSVLLELVCPMPPNDSVYDALDERVGLVLEADHRGFVIPRIVFIPSAPWRAQYPMEMQDYERGAGDDPSIASDHFWGEAERSLRSLIEHARRTSYGDRVIGYHLERGEWFQPADGGYDRSYANREGFRRWLRHKYGDNEVALRASWFDGNAQFYAADIPPAPDAGANTAFFDPKRERRWIDFMEYTSDITADRVIGLARAVKEATDGRALVSACYGYTCEFTHPWSGHLALARLLECPDVDLLTGPASYSERTPGSSGAPPGPVSAIGLHGKLWVTEDDTKTHLGAAASKADPYNPRMESHAATEAVHLRTIGSALCHQTGIAWMDLWGEGWLDSDDTWSPLGLFTESMGKIARGRKRETPDVVALVDERSLCHFNGGQGLMQRVLHGNRESLQRCGASVGLYLQSDVTHKDFPTDAKLYMFLTPYRLPEDQREAVRERLRTPGRTLVWLYAVGSMTDRSALEEPTPDVVGLNLRPQSWNSEVGTRIVDSGHIITQGIADRQLGGRMRLSPSYYVDDDGPGLTVLGEYDQSGLPSLVLRSVQGWTTVFCGEPVLSPELLRGLCRYAGVHLYTRAPEDYAQAGYGWLVMHVLKDGQRTLSLPPGTAAWDVADGCCSQPDAKEYRAPVKARTTRLFAIAPADALQKLGFDMSRVRAMSVSAPPPPLPAPPPLPTAEPEGAALVKAAPAEMVVAETPADALVPVRDVGVGTVDGAPDGGLVEAERSQEQAEPTSKRRRRRGGRGRGRRRKAAAEQADGGAGPGPTPPAPYGPA